MRNFHLLNQPHAVYRSLQVPATRCTVVALPVPHFRASRIVHTAQFDSYKKSWACVCLVPNCRKRNQVFLCQNEPYGPSKWWVPRNESVAHPLDLSVGAGMCRHHGKIDFSVHLFVTSHLHSSYPPFFHIALCCLREHRDQNEILHRVENRHSRTTYRVYQTGERLFPKITFSTHTHIHSHVFSLGAGEKQTNQSARKHASEIDAQAVYLLFAHQYVRMRRTRTNQLHIYIIKRTVCFLIGIRWINSHWFICFDGMIHGLLTG